MNAFIVIFEQLVPISGGGTPRIRSLINTLMNRGHEVSIAASFNISKNNAYKIIKCKRIFVLKNVSRLDKNKIIKYMFYHPINILKVVLAAIIIRPEILIAHNSISGFAGLLAKKFTGCIVVLDITDFLFEYLSYYSVRNPLIHLLMKIGIYIENKVIKYSDKIITVSKAMKDILIQKGIERKKIQVVYDGVNKDLFKLDKNNATKIRNEYAANKDNVIMFHGVIDPQDRPEIIVKAANNVLAKFPKTIFWIVGKGAGLSALKNEVNYYDLKENFLFTGWIPYDKVHKFISACDIGLVILPRTASSDIRVTLKGFEYWACEKPIVVAELSALKEIVTPWRTGLFYEPDNPVDLAEKINILLENQKLGEAMGKEGRKLVEDKYDWSKLTSQFASICENYYKA